MNQGQLMQIVENFSRNIEVDQGEIKVVHIPDQKTVFIEPNAEYGRSIVLSEHLVDGKTYWAGYSTYSQIVYISQAA